MGKLITTLNPTIDYRYSFKKGMRGTDVAALQINLSEQVLADGVFGPKTKRDIEKLQERYDLIVDGIAGPDTQKALFFKDSKVAEKTNELPKGVLSSIAVGESGFFVAAFSYHPSDSGFDLGVFQDSITPDEVGNQTAYRNAYDIYYTANVTAKRMKGLFDNFKDSKYVQNPNNYGKLVVPEGREYSPRVYAWQLAIFSHNWPSAAYNLANRGSIYIDSTRDDDEADWIIRASGGRLRTPIEWMVSYIEKSTVYVKW
jgi:hypothetical protein